ncbi:MAG: hypothetical protein RL300_187, partial [Pseudomonadota bacterium]
YDTNKDFIPVGSMAYLPYVLLVNSQLPVNSVKEFVAYAKARPGKLSFASAGVGAGSHMAGEVFKAMTGVQMLHVPFKGGAPALVELAGGRVDALWSTWNAAMALIKAGKIKALAVTSEKRYEGQPDVQTFAEAGMPDYQERAWLGLFAPAGTPGPIVDKLNAEIAKVLQSPAIKEGFEAQGLLPLQTTRQQFADLLKRETATLAPIVKAENIRME